MSGRRLRIRFDGFLNRGFNLRQLFELVGYSLLELNGYVDHLLTQHGCRFLYPVGHAEKNILLYRETRFIPQFRKKRNRLGCGCLDPCGDPVRDAPTLLQNIPRLLLDHGVLRIGFVFQDFCCATRGHFGAKHGLHGTVQFTKFNGHGVSVRLVVRLRHFAHCVAYGSVRQHELLFAVFRLLTQRNGRLLHFVFSRADPQAYKLWNPRAS